MSEGRKELMELHFGSFISIINDKNIKEAVRQALSNCPDYFFKVPASSTGKYHPEFTLGEGGLVRHTQAATKIALALLEHPVYKFTRQEREIIIGALIIHDCVKSGFDYNANIWTVDEHPLLVEQLINQELKEIPHIEIMIQAVRSHMGPWTKGICPKPKTLLERFVHHCDYLASRKIFKEIDLS